MPFKPVGNGLFVLSYADEGDAAWARIKIAKPNFVITQNAQLPECIKPNDLQTAGIRVLSYVKTDFEKSVTNIQSIKSAVSASIALGFDGIFFDEIMGRASDYPGVTTAQLNDTYRDIVDVPGLQFKIFNPGVSKVDPLLFKYADIVCVENMFYETPTAIDENGTVTEFDPWRWLSVQGDPATDGVACLDEAKGRMDFFRSIGGFWYFSTPRLGTGASHYILPWQFEDFANHVKAGPDVT